FRTRHFGANELEVLKHLALGEELSDLGYEHPSLNMSQQQPQLPDILGRGLAVVRSHPFQYCDVFRSNLLGPLESRRFAAVAAKLVDLLHKAVQPRLNEPLPECLLRRQLVWKRVSGGL